MAKYPALEAELLSGEEHLRSGDSMLEVTLNDFWSWSSSDLVDNANRGVLAEFLVLIALGEPTRPRRSWDSFDVTGPFGIRIEVKTTSPWQSWGQNNRSALYFSIREARRWDTERGSLDETAARQADLYVFAVLESESKLDVDPLNLEQWRFHVLPARVLNEKAAGKKSVTLSSLRQLGARECQFAELRGIIEEIATAERQAA